MNFGDKIIVDHKLKRTREYRTSPKKKCWKKTPLKEPIEVIVIGERTLSNGYITYEYELGNLYTGEEYFKAYLVVSDMRTNPFYILKN